MSGSFSIREVKELCTHVVDCVNKTAPATERPTEFKMLRTTNVRGGWIDTRDVRYVDEDVFNRWTRRLLPERGDVVLTREAPLGEVGMIRTDEKVFLGQRLVLYRADPQVCDRRFLLYAMLGPDVQSELKRLGSGSTVEHLRVPDCETLPISCPSLLLQRKIGSVLGAIDDLIENNRRRIQLLEQMAQAIYREWFVHFRYPGHQDDALLDSPLGPVPKGWAAASPGTIGEITIGGDWGADNPEDEDWIEVACLRGVDLPRLRMGMSNGVKKRWVKPASLEKRRLEPHDVVVEGSGECGRSLAGNERLEELLGCPVIYSNFCKRIRFRSSAVAMYAARHFNNMVADGSMRSYKTGTTIPNLNFRALIESHLMVIPPSQLLQRYQEVCGPMEEFALLGENRRLLAVRDLLLPKLVTGKIDLSSIDLDPVA